MTNPPLYKFKHDARFCKVGESAVVPLIPKVASTSMSRALHQAGLDLHLTSQVDRLCGEDATVIACMRHPLERFGSLHRQRAAFGWDDVSMLALAQHLHDLPDEEADCHFRSQVSILNAFGDRPRVLFHYRLLPWMWCHVQNMGDRAIPRLGHENTGRAMCDGWNLPAPVRQLVLERYHDDWMAFEALTEQVRGDFA